MDREWVIEQLDFTGIESIERNESLFTLGNGYLGLRGTLPYNSKRESGSYINGFYEKGAITYGEKAYGFAENWQTMVAIPEGRFTDITVDGSELFAESGEFVENRRILDMKTSSSIWYFNWKDKNGNTFKGHLRTAVPFHYQGAAIYSWEIELPESGMNVELKSHLYYPLPEDMDTDDPRVSAHFNGKTINPSKDLEKRQLTIEATGSKKTLVSGIDHVITGLSDQRDLIIDEADGFAEIIKGKASDLLIINKYVCYSYGESSCADKSSEEVESTLEEIKVEGPDVIFTTQSDFMDNFWETGDIRIEGDSEAQASLRFNLFQLLQSVGRDGQRSIAAKGLSGPGYEGHYFWDAETYVFPYFVYSHPEIARSMILYRISILEKAKDRARVLGHSGALYPWRTINGEESSAYFPAGTAQYHINSDVALSLVKYLEVTGDRSILSEGGAAILKETSLFWLSLGDYVEGKGVVFTCVTGPDEYTALVDNNYYTNLMAKENLLQAAKWLHGIENQELIDNWKKFANDIYLPEGVEITPQDDTFLQKPIWDFENTPKSKHPLLLHFHPLDIYRKQVLKQADVVMAQSLNRGNFTPELHKRNFDYYEQLTTRDSSLSACAQGIVGFWLGYDELSWNYFLETVHTDRKDLHNNVAHGLHTASMGGAYQMILKGYLGQENFNDTLRFRPGLPKALTKIALNLKVQGNILGIELVKDKITYSAVSGDLSFYHYSNIIELKEGESTTLNSGPEIKAEIEAVKDEDIYIAEKLTYEKIVDSGYLPEEIQII